MIDRKDNIPDRTTNTYTSSIYLNENILIDVLYT